MDRETYESFYNYLKFRVYPRGYTKDEKRNLRKKIEKYVITEGLLFYKTPDGKGQKVLRQAVTLDEKDDIIQMAHIEHVTGGHFSRDKTYNIIGERYYWKGLKADVHKFIRNCDHCVQMDNTQFSNHSSNHPLPRILSPTKPWTHVGLVILGPFSQTKSGFQFIIAMSDLYSKWPEVGPMKSKAHEEVAQFVWTVITRHGCMVTIITDRDAEFSTGLNDELCSKLGVFQQIVRTYNTEEMLLPDYFDRGVLQELENLIEKHPEDWEDYLDGLLFVYRTLACATLTQSPFYLMYNRKPRLPSSLNCRINYFKTEEQTLAVSNNVVIKPELKKITKKEENTHLEEDEEMQDDDEEEELPDDEEEEEENDEKCLTIDTNV